MGATGHLMITLPVAQIPVNTVAHSAAGRLPMAALNSGVVNQTALRRGGAQSRLCLTLMPTQAAGQ